MVQLYTSMAMDGAGVPRRIKDEIVHELKANDSKWNDVVKDGVEKLSGTHPRSLASLAAIAASKKSQETGASDAKPFGDALDEELASLGLTLASAADPEVPVPNVVESVALLNKDVEELKAILSHLGSSERLQLEDVEIDALYKGDGTSVSLADAIKEAEREAEETIRQLTSLQVKDSTDMVDVPKETPKDLPVETVSKKGEDASLPVADIGSPPSADASGKASVKRLV